MKKRIGCFIAALFVLPIYVSGCGEVTEAPLVEVDSEEDVVSYSTVQASIGDVILTRSIDCKYAQTNEQEVSFNVTGKYVSKVYVTEGDVVKKGDLLCELSSTDLETNIERLQYNIKKNELQLSYYDTNEALDIQDQWVNATSFGTPNEVVGDIVTGIKERYARQRVLLNDTLEFDREELAKLQKELRDSRLYASMDGIVYRPKEHLEGSTTRMGEVVMTIVDNQNCLFEVEDMTYKDLFKAGEYVDMKIGYSAAAGDYVLLPYEIDKWEDKMRFEIYTGPDEATIDVGQTGTITVLADSREKVLSLPKDVVHLTPDSAFVYTLNSDNIREIRYVEVGLMGDERIEILSGLVDGEKVVRK